MHWPEYNPRKKQNSPGRGLAVLLTLAISVLMAGELNGWWQIPRLSDNPEAEANGVVIVETATVFLLNESQPTYKPPLTPVPVKNAADFALPDLFHETITRRRSEYNGRPLILNFWASWCAPCREEMPALQQVFEANQENGLVILGINETYIDDLEAARNFVNELGLTFPNARDDNGEVSDQLYQVIGLPTSVFITAEGKIAHVQIGQMTDRQIDDYSRRLIAGDEIVP